MTEQEEIEVGLAQILLCTAVTIERGYDKSWDGMQLFYHPHYAFTLTIASHDYVGSKLLDRARLGEHGDGDVGKAFNYLAEKCLTYTVTTCREERSVVYRQLKDDDNVFSNAFGLVDQFRKEKAAE